ncbi:hypothetical protein LguiB_013208 [Lonicera macranthoides]
MVSIVRHYGPLLLLPLPVTPPFSSRCLLTPRSSITSVSGIKKGKFLFSLPLFLSKI